MSNRTDYLFEMEFKHNYGHGRLSLFKENFQNEESSYWINAYEHIKKTNNSETIAVMFTNEQLIELRDVLNKLNI